MHVLSNASMDTDDVNAFESVKHCPDFQLPVFCEAQLTEIFALTKRAVVDGHRSVDLRYWSDHAPNGIRQSMWTAALEAR